MEDSNLAMWAKSTADEWACMSTSSQRGVAESPGPGATSRTNATDRISGRSPNPLDAMKQHETRQVGLVAALAVALLGGGLLFATGGGDSSASASAKPVSVPPEQQPSVDNAATQPTNADPASATGGTVGADAGDTTEETGAASAGDETGCVLTERSIGPGSKGKNVECLQEALQKAGYFSGDIDGVYGNATAVAVRKLQTDKDMFVDGIAGRETGLKLGIWPDEQSQVIRTPKPKKGAKDLAGFLLSSVASAGEDAPPLPDNSGSGRRLVYSRAGQRIWAVDSKGRIVRSWLISGSKYNNETPGVHKVYSRSAVTTAWNGQAFLHKMVRWLDTERGAIGFHQIPTHRSDGSVYQTEAELGTRLSGGCQRQAPLDAAFTWAWATVGTPVVVL